MNAKIKNFNQFRVMLSVILFFILISSNLSTAQMSKLPSNKYENKNKNLKTETSVTLKSENNQLTKTPINNSNFSDKEKLILSQIEQLKKPGNSKTEGEKILQLQKELEKTNGSTVTRQGTNDFGKIIPASKFNSQQTDNLTFSYILFDAGNYIASLAAQVEQTGATAGKIWVAVGLFNGDTGYFSLPDTIAIFYSADDGSSYNLYAKIAFSGSNRLEFDDMDMEIIENSSGTKYLHIVFGYRPNGGYGQRLIGYTVVSAPSLGYAGSTLFPPGYNSSSNYTKVRLTSDNTRYPGIPYITMVITQDSVSGGQSYFMSKVCKVLSPFTLTPSVTYLPQSIYGVAPGFNYDVFTDVANYHNGSDSLIFVLSSYAGFESSIYFYKAYSNSVVYPIASGSAVPTGDNIEYARIAANGGTNQTKLMITYTDNYLNSGDFDQWILTTDDANSWSASSLDFTPYNNSRYGDVVGRRNANGSFAISFKNIFGNMDNVSTFSFTDLNQTSFVHKLNTDYANTFASPKPLFKYVNNDSCLNIWSYFYSASSTGGCAASNLYITTALQGFYDEGTDQHANYVYEYVMLAEASAPYNIVDSGLAYLDFDGMSNAFTFPKGLTGDYYLVVKQYNCIETWSAAPVHVEPYNHSFYDFTSSNAQSYGNNMVQKGSRWCFYSGDVNQDGTIDLNDVVNIYNDASMFVAVLYDVTDLNGDSFTDLSDLLLGFNNASLFVTKITP